jgi:hypothetical protein
MTCVDCLNCKVTYKWTRLKCAKGYWKYMSCPVGKSQERFVKLNGGEINNLDIKPRNLFTQAARCLNFTSMCEGENHERLPS